jgi:hypothetical protein
MDSTQVGVLKKTHKKGLGSLLQRQYGHGLEAQVVLQMLRRYVLGDLTDQPLEGSLPDEQLSALLILPATSTRESVGSQVAHM